MSDSGLLAGVMGAYAGSVTVNSPMERNKLRARAWCATDKNREGGARCGGTPTLALISLSNKSMLATKEIQN